MKIYLFIILTIASKQITTPSRNLEQLVQNFKQQRKLLNEQPQQKIQLDLEMTRNKEQFQDPFVYDMITDPAHLQELEEERKKKKTLPTYLSDFTYIMFIGKTVNKFYNQAVGLIQKPQFEGINDQTKYGLNSYEDIKKAIQMFYHPTHFEAMRQEVELFYNSLERLVIRTSDCLEFFGLSEYFHGIKIQIDLDSISYNNKQKLLDEFISTYSERIKQFFVTLMNLKYFGDFLDMFTEFHKDDILEGRLDKSEKIAIGTRIMIRLMGIQQEMKQGLENIIVLQEIGIDFRKMLVMNLNFFKNQKKSFLKLPDISYQNDETLTNVEQNSFNYTPFYVIKTLTIFILLFNQQ